MGTPWSAALPVVYVAAAAAPKRVTIVLPFYENSEFLAVQVSGWQRWPADLRAHVEAVIVDDGSPEPAADVLRYLVPPFPWRLFRIREDRRWNWLAARNRGAHEAADGWLLMTDMDHVVPEATMAAVVMGAHDPAVIYGFRRRESSGARLQPHPNSWLLTRARFWSVGGYDETLSGYYGTDGDWRRRCARVARLQILSDELIRHEYDGDSSTRRYRRKQPEDAAVKRLIAARAPDWQPKTLSFPADEVAL
jgi:hypothetical protein